MNPKAPVRSLPILGVFARYPAPGEAKSRLAAGTTREWAAQAARAFLLDTLDRVRGLAGACVLAFTPASVRSEMLALIGDGWEMIPQAGGDLGERMTAFLRAQFVTGRKPVVVIGTDSPTLPVAFIERAFAELERVDVVLGPASDGGYYLLGCRDLWPTLFQGIPWGTSRVLLETVRRVEQLGLNLALLPPWYDVDTLADWHLLCGHLRALRQAGIDPGVPRTEALATVE